jgi:hypothetical protein
MHQPRQPRRPKPSWRSGPGYVFWVLSDIHADSADNSFSGRCEKLLRDILHAWEEIRPLFEGDLHAGILLVGDLTKRSARAEYRLFQNNILERLQRHLGLESTSIFSTPGNHDHLRGVIDHADPKHPKNIKAGNKRGYLAGNDGQWEEQVGSRFFLYDWWAREHARGASAERTAGPWTTSVPIPPDGVDPGFKIKLAALNSAIASNGRGGGANGDDAGLWIHDEQVNLALPEPKRRNTVALTLMHHPPYFLDDREHDARQTLFERSDIILHGHIHQRDWNPANSARPVILGAPSFGHPDAGTIGDLNHRDGCAILRVERKRAQMFFLSHREAQGHLASKIDYKTENGLAVPDCDEPLRAVPIQVVGR